MYFILFNLIFWLSLIPGVITLNIDIKVDSDEDSDEDGPPGAMPLNLPALKFDKPFTKDLPKVIFT